MGLRRDESGPYSGSGRGGKKEYSGSCSEGKKMLETEESRALLMNKRLAFFWASHITLKLP